MPYTAYVDAKHTRIEGLSHTQIERLRRSDASITCPYCGADMIVVNGAVLAAHFRHPSKRECTHVGHPMSPEHRRAQLLLEEYFAGDYELSCVALEAPVDMTWRTRGRVVDVLLELEDLRVAHEVQLSPITLRELTERSQDYEKAGIEHVVWWLGDRNAALVSHDLGPRVELVPLEMLEQRSQELDAILTRSIVALVCAYVSQTGCGSVEASMAMHGVSAWSPCYAYWTGDLLSTFTPASLVREAMERTRGECVQAREPDPEDPRLVELLGLEREIHRRARERWNQRWMNRGYPQVHSSREGTSEVDAQNRALIRENELLRDELDELRRRHEEMRRVFLRG